MEIPARQSAKSDRGETLDGARRPLVLVVDDDRAVRRLVRRALEGVGCAVLEAGDGLEAFRVVEAHPVALVITDLLMPERDGIEVVLGMTARESPIPVIVMSGGGTGLDLETLVSTALALGAVAALAKPFSVAALAATVTDVLGAAPPYGGAPAA